MPNRQRIPKRLRRGPQKRSMRNRDGSSHASLGVSRGITPKNVVPGGAPLTVPTKSTQLIAEYCVITMSTEQSKTDQYQIRLSHAFRAQLEEQARIDGDKTLATWLKRVLRKELLSRGIEPKG